MKLDVEASRGAIKQHIADPLGMSVQQAAWGIHQIANENMANAARVHTLERGRDPSRFPLLAFGGGGPMQAYRIAVSLGSPELIVPLGAGVMSTVGFLSAPIAFDFVRSSSARLSEVDWNHINSLLNEMETQGSDMLVQSGIEKKHIKHRRSVEMRFVGQGHQLAIELPGGILSAASVESLESAFAEVYQQLYQRTGPPVEIEATNWRVVSSGPKPDLQLNITGSVSNTMNGSKKSSEAIKGTRQAYFPETDGFVQTNVYDRYQMQPGMSFTGPAIIEERESTVILGPKSQSHIDEQFNLVVKLPTG